MLQNTRAFRAHSTSPAVRIVVDSCCSLDAGQLRDLGLDCVEFPFVLDGEERRDDQWESMSAHEFNEAMRRGARPSTSAIPTGEFAELFGLFAQEGVPTVYLSLTGELSSSVRDAQEAREQVLRAHPDFPLEVVDSRMPSLTAGMVAMELCRLRDAGAGFEQVVEAARTLPDHVHGYFTLDSLKWLASGGRIPKSAASASALLDVKASLGYALDGALTLTGVSRGRKKALKRLVAKFEENYRPGSAMCIGIADADCPQDAAQLEDMVRASLAARGQEVPPICHWSVDPTIGSHVGPGMLALAFWGRDRAASGFDDGRR